MPCLDEGDLTALIEGRLDASAREAALAHVDGCGACRRVLAAVAAGDPGCTTTMATDESPESTPVLRGRGDCIGRYVILEPVGVGGMGVVYAAYDPELDRKVALKLLRPRATLDRAAMRARLLREAQAMARVSHPNVVSVFDAGTHGDEVFLSMEFVEGQTLKAWLREKPRPLGEILARFVDAGRGLAAAHGAGLVHRDFKPDNVLVAVDGRVRVTDFGLARASEGEQPTLPSVVVPLRPKGDTSASATATGAVLGTPAYMAPEQLDGRPADARTDVFSFCVALYEALYGHRPFGGDDLDSLRAAIVSERVASSPSGRSVPRFVRRALVRGLRSSPEARYPAMAPLLHALTRDPRRWWGRAAWSAGLVGIGAAVVALFSSNAGGFAPCRGLQARLEPIWNAGRRAAIGAAFARSGLAYAAETGVRVESAVDAYARRWLGMQTEACEATRVRAEQPEEVLALRSGCLDRRLSSLAAVLTVLERADAVVVERAASAVASLPSLAICADPDVLRARKVLPSDASTLRAVRSAEVMLASVRAMQESGKWREGLSAARQLGEEARHIGYAPLLAEAQFALGLAQAEMGTLEEATQALSESYFAALAGREDETLAEAATQLVWVVGGRGRDFAAADGWAGHARGAVARLGGVGSYEAALESILGSVRRRQGKADVAVVHHRRAVALFEAPEEVARDRRGLADALGNLAIALLDLSRFEEAEAALRRAIILVESLHGPSHPKVALLGANLGKALTVMGRYRAADRELRRALAIREQVYGDKHPKVANALEALLANETGAGRFEQAIAVGRRALAIADPKGDAVTPLFSQTAYVFGVTLSRAHRFDEGRALLERSLAIREKKLGPKHLLVGWVRLKLGMLEARAGNLDAADAHLARVFEILPVGDRREALGVGSAYLNRGRLRFAQGRLAEARADLEEARGVFARLFGAEHPLALRAGTCLGRVALAEGDRARAEKELEAVVGAAARSEGDPRIGAHARFELARLVVGENPVRAAALASQARGVFASKEYATPEALAALDAWRAAARRPR